MLGGVLTFDELLARAAGEARRAEPTRFGRCARLWDGAARRRGAGVSDSSDRAVRRLRPAADRRDRARGERGHRQDVHDRRARGALRRRGHPARPAAARHVHADGDRRAARARARAARQRRAGRSSARWPARRRTTTRSCALLADGTPRRSRCGARGSPRALADFDAATIATTHGFCQEVLGGLGVAGDVEPDVTFVEDVGDLRRRGRRRPLRAPLPPPRRRRPFNRAQALRIARVGDRQPGRADRAGRRARRRVAGDARAARRRGPRASSSCASAAPAS